MEQKPQPEVDPYQAQGQKHNRSQPLVMDSVNQGPRCREGGERTTSEEECLSTTKPPDQKNHSDQTQPTVGDADTAFFNKIYIFIE